MPYTDCADVPLEVTLSNSKDFSFVSKSGGLKHIAILTIKVTENILKKKVF